MSIEPGQRLLHYELVAQIGEGGMGVVWRGRDTKLDRDVPASGIKCYVNGIQRRSSQQSLDSSGFGRPNTACPQGCFPVISRYIGKELRLGCGVEFM